MADIAVKADDLWKSYEIHPVYSIWGKARRVANRLLGRGPEREPFWALREVAFEVEKGEAFGIIGPNGAGKSTLLKILGGVTAATRGSVTIKGRVAPLIELGAGFSPDLSGRENVIINGVVLGMTLREVRRKYDAIVEFAGLGEFMDTPVKKYSSGMLVRLGFAVAAHTDPDVLLVDEVLAVGDAEFRRKSAAKMRELRCADVTLIIVSHSMPHISSVCGRAAYLRGGEVKAIGTPADVIRHYQSDLPKLVQRCDPGGGRVKAGPIRIERLAFWNPEEDTQTAVLWAGEEGRIEIEYNARLVVSDLAVGVAITDWRGERLSGFNTKIMGIKFPVLEGKGTIQICIPGVPLPAGNYAVTVALHDANLGDYDRIEGMPLEVHSHQVMAGQIHMPHRWRINGVALSPSEDGKP